MCDRTDYKTLKENNFKLFRKCKDCNLVFEHSDFGKDKTCKWGISRRCMSCFNLAAKSRKKKYRATEKAKNTEAIHQKRYYEANKEILKKKRKDYYYSKEGSIKTKEYMKSEKRKEALRKYYHESTGKERQKANYENNKEEVLRKNKEYYVKNRERILERAKKYGKEYRKSNRDKAAKRKLKRRIAERNSIPSWSEVDKIKILYEKASWLSELTGLTYHVDHIIPIQNENVCGLHVWANLQILEASLNCSKGNKLEVYFGE